MSLKHQVQQLEEKVAEVIATQRRFPAVSLATLLHGGSLLYGTAIGIRNLLYKRGVLPIGQVERPVISVGNLTAGGTGKTPMTVHLAAMLKSRGFKVLIVSRGYKSQGEKAGAVVCDGETLLGDAHSVGDEPCLMARLLGEVPVMVGSKRLITASAGLRRFSPDVILLDDGFQHQRLARDLNLVLMDAKDPLGNGHLIPRGPLREPISALERADAIIFTRSRQSDRCPNRRFARIISSKPVFHSNHRTVIRFIRPAYCQDLMNGVNLAHHRSDRPGATVGGRQLFAFSALANNDAFFSAAASVGGEVLGTMGFADHHFYNREDIDAVIRNAHNAGCNAVVTTDKDFVRLPEKLSLPVDLIVLGVEIDFGEDGQRWQHFIFNKLANCMGRT